MLFVRILRRKAVNVRFLSAVPQTNRTHISNIHPPTPATETKDPRVPMLSLMAADTV